MQLEVGERSARTSHNTFLTIAVGDLKSGARNSQPRGTRSGRMLRSIVAPGTKERGDLTRGLVCLAIISDRANSGHEVDSR